MVDSSAHRRIRSANTNAGRAIEWDSTGEFQRFTVNAQSATSSTTRTGGSPSRTQDSPLPWDTEAVSLSSAIALTNTACSPSKSLPSTSFAPKAEAEQSTNGNPAPNNPTTTGSTVWSAALSVHRCRGHCYSVPTLRRLHSVNGSVSRNFNAEREDKIPEQNAAPVDETGAYMLFVVQDGSSCVAKAPLCGYQ